jgi:hypothetical protein
MRDSVEERIYRALASYRATAAVATPAEATVLGRSRVGAPIERRFSADSDMFDADAQSQPAAAAPVLVPERADAAALGPTGPCTSASADGEGRAALCEAVDASQRSVKRPREVVEIEDDDDEQLRASRDCPVQGVLRTALSRSLEVSVSALAMCTAMGFGEAAAKAALISVDNDVERAVALLLR